MVTTADWGRDSLRLVLTPCHETVPSTEATHLQARGTLGSQLTKFSIQATYWRHLDKMIETME